MDGKQNLDLSNERRSYEKFHLDERSVTDNPMDLFQGWYNMADASDLIEEANAMTLATIRPEGTPRSRVVLLKRFTWEGFYFYTNYHSEKGRDIAGNPAVCLSFFWDALERQVIIEGTAEIAPESASDGYFATRPRGSRLGAWASDQSEVVPSREFLDKRLEEFEKKYEGQDVPRPRIVACIWCALRSSNFGRDARTGCTTGCGTPCKRIFRGSWNGWRHRN